MESESLKALDTHEWYHIGWIAALPIELAAARAMLDEEHTQPLDFVQPQNDSNCYNWGRIGDHNVVIASLPAGVYGTTRAATTASQLLSSFPQIRVGLLVGIRAGIPTGDVDIRLGDVVVSQPHGQVGGVVQWDFQMASANAAPIRRGHLDKPPELLLKALAML